MREIYIFSHIYYIATLMARISIYHKIADAENSEEILNVTDELIDRFVDIPKCVDNRINVAQIRNIFRKLDITKIYSISNVVYSNTKNVIKKYKFMVNKGEILINTEMYLKDILSKKSKVKQ